MEQSAQKDTMCSERMENRKKNRRKRNENRTRGTYSVEQRFAYTIVTHSYIQSHVRSANRHTFNTKLKMIKIKGGDGGCRMEAFLFVSVKQQPSRDNINIKFIYPLQIWCDVFLSFFHHFHHIIIRCAYTPTRGEALWNESVQCAVHEPCHKCKPKFNQHKVTSIHTDVLSLFFSAPQFHFGWAILKCFMYEDIQTQSEMTKTTKRPIMHYCRRVLRQRPWSVCERRPFLFHSSSSNAISRRRAWSLYLTGEGQRGEGQRGEEVVGAVFFIRNGKERITWANPTHSFQLNRGCVSAVRRWTLTNIVVYLE